MNTLANAVVNGAIVSIPVVFTVWAALRLSRRTVNAATRYWIWWTVLAIVLALPLAYLSAPIPAAGPENLPVAVDFGAAPLPPTIVPRATAPAPSAPRVAPTLPAFPIRLGDSTPWLRGLAAVWILVTVGMLIRLLASWIALRRHCAYGHADADRWLARLGRGRRRVRVTISDRVDCPVAVGPHQPCILIPERLAQRLSRAEFDCVGLHEAAHLVRRDDLALLVQRSIEALYALHPLVRWIARRLDLEREMACDAMVVAATGDSRGYALCLTRLMEECGLVYPQTAGAPIGSSLTRRIDSILESKSSARPTTSRIRLGAAVAALTVLAWTVTRAPAVFAFPQQPLPTPVAAPATPTAAATPIRGEIRGVVREPGLGGAPIAEAEITIDDYGPTQPRFMPSPPQRSFKTVTSATGSFAFAVDHAGYFGVHAKKDGFREAGTTPSAATRVHFTLSEAAPNREVTLFLSRPASVTGTVVDAETGKPLPDVKIAGGPVMYFAGRRILMQSSASTGADGRFTINGNPGDYVVQVGGQTPLKERVRQSFTDEEAAGTDEDFERSFWPGGFGEEAASPLPVGSGATVDLGRIRVKKAPYYRARLRIPKSNCNPGDALTVFLVTPIPQFGTNTVSLSENVPCGIDLLVTGFAPGSYQLVLGTRTAPRGTAGVPVVITNRNVEATVTLSRGMTVEGRIVSEPGGAPVDLTRISVWLDPIGRIRYGDSFRPATPAADGAFRAENVPEAPHRVNVTGVPPSHYVKEIRHNGAVANGPVELDRPAVAHQLTIVLDDKPASILGTTKDGDRPVAQAVVLAAKWPLPVNDIFVPLRAVADDQGRFQLTGLAPGEYRIVAVRSAADEQERRPGTLEQAMAAASKIELGARESRTLTLTPRELR